MLTIKLSILNVRGMASDPSGTLDVEFKGIDSRNFPLELSNQFKSTFQWKHFKFPVEFLQFPLEF